MLARLHRLLLREESRCEARDMGLSLASVVLQPLFDLKRLKT